MTALAEAWRLAEVVLRPAPDGFVVHGVSAGIAEDLARALLKLKPVIERAIEMQDIDAELVGMGIGGIVAEDRKLYDAVANLYDALDELRGAR